MHLRDKENQWHKFFLQQKGNSCGPTCVRTILLAHTDISLPSEVTLRNLMGLVETGVWNYYPSGDGYGWFNPHDTADPAVIVTHRP